MVLKGYPLKAGWGRTTIAERSLNYLQYDKSARKKRPL